MRSPATTAKVVDLVRRFAMSISSSTEAMPRSAVVMRQPHPDSGPSTIMPSAMIHLPSGGCTTNAGFVVNTSGSPDRNRSFPSPGQDASYPRFSSVQASLT